mgnify:CR=1 FL=1
MDIAKLVATIIVDYDSKSKSNIKELTENMTTASGASNKVVEALQVLKKKLDDIGKVKITNINKVASSFSKLAKTTGKSVAGTNNSAAAMKKASAAANKLTKASRNQQGVTKRLDKSGKGLVQTLTNKIAKWRVLTGLASFATNALMTPVRVFMTLTKVALGATAAIGGFTVATTAMTREQVGTAKALDVSVQHLRAWRVLVTEAGVSADSAMDIMEEFRTSIQDALQDPKGDIAQAFQSAGTSAQELQDIINNSSTETAFSGFTDQLQTLGQGSKAAGLLVGQLADRIFKGEGQKIFTLLTTLERPVSKIITDLKKLSLQDEGSIRGAQRFQSAWTKASMLISTAFQQIAGTLGNSIAPLLENAILSITKNTPQVMQDLRILGYQLAVVFLKGVTLAANLAVAVKSFFKIFSDDDTALKGAKNLIDGLITSTRTLVVLLDKLALLSKINSKASEIRKQEDKDAKDLSPIAKIGRNSTPAKVKRLISSYLKAQEIEASIRSRDAGNKALQGLTDEDLLNRSRGTLGEEIDQKDRDMLEKMKGGFNLPAPTKANHLPAFRRASAPQVGSTDNRGTRIGEVNVTVASTSQAVAYTTELDYESMAMA